MDRQVAEVLQQLRVGDAGVQRLLGLLLTLSLLVRAPTDPET